MDQIGWHETPLSAGLRKVSRQPAFKAKFLTFVGLSSSRVAPQWWHGVSELKMLRSICVRCIILVAGDRPYCASIFAVGDVPPRQVRLVTTVWPRMPERICGRVFSQSQRGEAMSDVAPYFVHGVDLMASDCRTRKLRHHGKQVTTFPGPPTCEQARPAQTMQIISTLGVCHTISEKGKRHARILPRWNLQHGMLVMPRIPIMHLVPEISQSTSAHMAKMCWCDMIEAIE